MEEEGGVGVRLRVRVRTKTIRRNELLALPPLTQGKLLVQGHLQMQESWGGCLGFTVRPSPVASSEVETRVEAAIKWLCGLVTSSRMKPPLYDLAQALVERSCLLR